MKTDIVSFYSDIDDRTYYSDHARRFRINCNENNIPYKEKKDWELIPKYHIGK